MNANIINRHSDKVEIGVNIFTLAIQDEDNILTSVTVRITSFSPLSELDYSSSISLMNYHLSFSTPTINSYK
jgi:hypothetical protein